MSKVFFTADTHFGSERTLTLSRRPFKTVKEMDETLINNWNSVVGKDDIVYHLGDFGNYEIVKRLNGKVTLIWGNYELNEFIKKYNILETLEKTNDPQYRNEILPLIESHSHLRDMLLWEYIINRTDNHTNISEFNEILESYGFDDIVLFGGTRIPVDASCTEVMTEYLHLVHEPIQCWKEVYIPKTMNLFGHIHGRQLVKKYGLDVGVDGHHFYPIDTETVLFYRNAIVNHYDENVFLQ